MKKNTSQTTWVYFRYNVFKPRIYVHQQQEQDTTDLLNGPDPPTESGDGPSENPASTSSAEVPPSSSLVSVIFPISDLFYLL